MDLKNNELGYNKPNNNNGSYDDSTIKSQIKTLSEELDSVQDNIMNEKIQTIRVSEIRDSFNDDWVLLKYVLDNFEYIYLDVDLDVDVDASYDINHSFHLTGTGSINFTSSQSVKNILCVNQDNINIVIENVKLNLDFNGRLITGSSANDGYLCNNVNLIKIDNCEIIGRGILVLFYVKTAEEEVNVKKVKTSIFTNNYIHDIKMEFQTLPTSTTNNYQCYGLFLVENVLIDCIVLNYNVIRNTERTIGQFKHRNAYSSLKGIIEIRFNNYINDDTCWGRNDDQDAMYYVFVMAEANMCVYEYNYVEGLKIQTYTITGGGRTVGTETYDLYALVRELQYKNNIIKNCMAFYTSNIVNSANSDLIPTIIKAKESLNICYENNKFIIEQSFIDNNNLLGDELNQTFCIVDNSVQANDEYDKQNLIIKNNLIKVPKLFFERERTDFLGTYEFSHNVIECDSIYGHVFYNARDIGDRIFSNNKITSTIDLNEPFRIIKGELSAVMLNSTIYIENNVINVPNFYKPITGVSDKDRYTFYSKYKRMIIKNNIFYRRPYIKDCFGDIISHNNYVTNSEWDNTFLSSRNIGRTHIKETFIQPSPFQIARWMVGDLQKTWSHNVYVNIRAVSVDGTVNELSKLIKFNGTTVTVDDQVIDISNCDEYINFDDFLIRFRTSSTPLFMIGVDSTSNTGGSGSGKKYIKVDFEVLSNPITV